MAKQVFRRANIQSPFSSTGECYEVKEEKVMKYMGLEFTVWTRYYKDKETGEEFTTSEQDQEWWDDMKRQYFEYLSMIIQDGAEMGIYETFPELIIFKNPWETGAEKYKASSENLNLDFLESPEKTTEFLISGKTIGSGRTPAEAVKDLYYKKNNE